MISLSRAQIRRSLNVMSDFLFREIARFARVLLFRIRTPTPARHAWMRFFGSTRSGAGVAGCRCRVSVSKGLPALSCREDDPCFRSGRCLFVLDRTGKKLIHEIKYHGVRGILQDLPNWLDRTPGIREFLEGSILVPVPLHRKRMHERIQPKPLDRPSPEQGNGRSDGDARIV